LQFLRWPGVRDAEKGGQVMADLDDLNIQLTGIDSNLTIMHGLQEETNLLLKRIVDLLKELIDETKRSRDY